MRSPRCVARSGVPPPRAATALPAAGAAHAPVPACLPSPVCVAEHICAAMSTHDGATVALRSFRRRCPVSAQIASDCCSTPLLPQTQRRQLCSRTDLRRIADIAIARSCSCMEAGSTDHSDLEARASTRNLISGRHSPNLCYLTWPYLFGKSTILSTTTALHDLQDSGF